MNSYDEREIRKIGSEAVESYKAVLAEDAFSGPSLPPRPLNRSEILGEIEVLGKLLETVEYKPDDLYKATRDRLVALVKMLGK